MPSLVYLHAITRLSSITRLSRLGTSSPPPRRHEGLSVTSLSGESMQSLRDKLWVGHL
jgi:hypothetical protein